ncbi:unnamed protein product [Phytomonas sp. Hart1]|nr:unnamed protein product [Phytomonas sp. Hart1]|eukprot:CCW68305.1 unnamed protein product [Phytomonas sp. isolate Hart1]
MCEALLTREIVFSTTSRTTTSSSSRSSLSEVGELTSSDGFHRQPHLTLPPPQTSFSEDNHAYASPQNFPLRRRRFVRNKIPTTPHFFHIHSRPSQERDQFSLPFQDVSAVITNAIVDEDEEKNDLFFWGGSNSSEILSTIEVEDVECITTFPSPNNLDAASSAKFDSGSEWGVYSGERTVSWPVKEVEDIIPISSLDEHLLKENS